MILKLILSILSNPLFMNLLRRIFPSAEEQLARLKGRKEGMDKLQEIHAGVAAARKTRGDTSKLEEAIRE